MQISPLPGQQRHRKFKTHLKGVTEHHDIKHQEGHDPREDKHDQDDHHDDDHHDDNHAPATPQPAAPPPPAS
jgi:hypothetical protein